MKHYAYNEPGGERGEILELVVKTEEEILGSEWESWCEKMVSRYGPNSELITKENCIEDWVTTHYAWETDLFGDVADHTTLEEVTEQWFPVLGFRWLETERYGYVFRTLQQQHLSNTGKEKWVDIPTVTKRE